MRLTKVLVVDDEEQIGSLLTRILSRDGMHVTPCTTASAALASMQRERPDIVITDLMMPGINGLELASRVKALHPSTSIIVITGFASLENVVDALRSGVDDFVTKPFGAAEIRAVVQRVMARRAEVPSGEIPPAPVAAESGSGAELLLDCRLRDMGILETVHAMVGVDVESRDLAHRCARMLHEALGVSRAAIVVPGERDGALRILSTTGAGAAPDRQDDLDLPVLARVKSSGSPAPMDIASVGDLAAHLDLGPSAAAPLRPKDGAGPDAGLLVASRPAGAPSFEPEDLRVLGVAAAAMGDVLHALRGAERAEAAYLASLVDVVTATEQRAPWFLDHAARVRELSVRLGERVGLPESEIDVLDSAAQLLDIGRLRIGNEVLSKSGRLSTEEWRTLRSHTEIADTLVQPLGKLRHVKPVIRHHHENWDGSGYPDGLSGDDIPYLAALVRITDSYAALTSPRPWRAALAPAEAVRRIVDFSGTHFHPQLVAAFAQMQMPAHESESPSHGANVRTARSSAPSADQGPAL